jgi:hypothetical protein
MYFYYFLGYQLEAGKDEAGNDLSTAQKDERAMNTYCLALGYLSYSHNTNL